MSGKCPKCESELHWYPAINEEGWRCCSCEFKPGEPAGYEPRLDVELIEVNLRGRWTRRVLGEDRRRSQVGKRHPQPMRGRQPVDRVNGHQRS